VNEAEPTFPKLSEAVRANLTSSPGENDSLISEDPTNIEVVNSLSTLADTKSAC
jgi:hypothetical protein